MTNYFSLFIYAALIDNLILVRFLGLCPFMGASKEPETAIGIGLATTFVMTFASVYSWIVNTFILVPLNLVYLRTLTIILTVAFSVQITEMIIRKTSLKLYHLLGIFLPLITTNCAILGVSLLNINRSYNFLQSAIYGFSSSVGFFLVIVLFSFIRERIAIANVPTPFRGSSINLITAGLMSLAFYGLNGLIKF